MKTCIPIMPRPTFTNRDVQFQQFPDLRNSSEHRVLTRGTGGPMSDECFHKIHTHYSSELNMDRKDGLVFS